MLGYKEIFTKEALKNKHALSFYSCGISKCKPLHTYGPRARFYHLIHVVLSGKGVLVIDGKSFELTAGSAFYIPPGSLAVYQADKEQPWKYCWMGYCGSEAEVYTNLLFKEGTFVLRYIDVSYVQRFFEKIFLKNVTDIESLETAQKRADDDKSYFYMTNTLSGYMGLNAEVYRLFSFFLNDKEEEQTEAAPVSSYAEHAKEFVDCYFNEDIGIREVADAIGLHMNYLSALFKKRYHITLKKYIDKTRIEHACSLLISTDYPIYVIARSVGISNPAVFSQIFHKLTGKTAKQFREYCDCK